MTTSLLDVRVDGHPTLRECAGVILPDDVLKQLEIWEQCNNHMIGESQKQRIAGIERMLCTLGTAFEVTGNAHVARVLAKIANNVSDLITR